MWTLAPYRTLASALLLAALGLSAATCAQTAEPEAPATAQTANASPAETRTARTTQPPDPDYPNGTDLSRLDAASRSCLSDRLIKLSPGETFYEVSQTRGELGRYVHIVVLKPGQSLDDGTAQALLLFRDDGSCASMLDYEGMVYSLEDGTSDDTRDEIVAAFDRWQTAYERGEIE